MRESTSIDKSWLNVSWWCLWCCHLPLAACRLPLEPVIRDKRAPIKRPDWRTRLICFETTDRQELGQAGQLGLSLVPSACSNNNNNDTCFFTCSVCLSGRSLLGEQLERGGGRGGGNKDTMTSNCYRDTPWKQQGQWQHQEPKTTRKRKTKLDF